MKGLEQDRALIRALIEYAGLSAAQVARKAKLDPKTIERHASARAVSRLSQRTVEKLHDAFPKFPGWTRAGAAALTSFEEPDLSAEEEFLLEQFGQLSLDDRNTVLALIEVLTQKAKPTPAAPASRAVHDKQSTYRSPDMD